MLWERELFKLLEQPTWKALRHFITCPALPSHRWDQLESVFLTTWARGQHIATHTIPSSSKTQRNGLCLWFPRPFPTVGGLCGPTSRHSNDLSRRYGHPCPFPFPSHTLPLPVFSKPCLPHLRLILYWTLWTRFLYYWYQLSQVHSFKHLRMLHSQLQLHCLAVPHSFLDDQSYHASTLLHLLQFCHSPVPTLVLFLLLVLLTSLCNRFQPDPNLLCKAN